MLEQNDPLHGYSGKTVAVTLLAPVTFTHPDHVREVFPAGIREVPIEVASVPFFAHHTNEPPQPRARPGTAEYTAELRSEAAEAQRRIAESTRVSALAREAIQPEVLRADIERKLREEFAAQFAALKAQPSLEDLKAQARAEIQAEQQGNPDATAKVKKNP